MGLIIKLIGLGCVLFCFAGFVQWVYLKFKKK